VGAFGSMVVSLSTEAMASSPPPKSGCVSLSSSLKRPSRPTIVFIHGLDSAKDTWTTVQANLLKDQYPSIALDLRGHGESPLGKHEEFTPSQLAADIRASIITHNIPRPFVLCGHSMGGMVVMRYAAQYPSDLSALVIEDMDIRPRRNRPFTASEFKRHEKFSRFFPSAEIAKATLVSFGYAPERVDGWFKTGRVYPVEGGYWSNINPMARYLACQHVLSSSDARKAFSSISTGNLPTYLFVAGRGSVCKEEGKGGVLEMCSILPRLKVSRFPQGYHSIHNTAQDEFLSEIKHIVDKAQTDSTEASIRARM